MKERSLADQAIYMAARRSTVQSAHLEERDIPSGFHRTLKSDRYLHSRIGNEDGLDEHAPNSSPAQDPVVLAGMNPGYGSTPLPFDELDALLSQARASLGEPVMRADIYDLEQELEADNAERLLIRIDAGDLLLDDVLVDFFLRGLHKDLYCSVWAWAGATRQHEVSIGIDPWLITPELRASLDNMLWRYRNTDDWTARELGIAVHADCVRIHPFTDGNGRSTRLFADLVYLAAQMDVQGVGGPVETPGSGEFYLYDWNVDKREYIRLLREYDLNRDPTALARYVGVVGI